ARALDSRGADQQQQRRSEESQQVPLRAGAPREVAAAELANAILAVGDPSHQERATCEADEGQQEDRGLRREIVWKETESRRSEERGQKEDPACHVEEDEECGRGMPRDGCLERGHEGRLSRCNHENPPKWPTRSAQLHPTRATKQESTQPLSAIGPDRPGGRSRRAN